MYTDNEIMFPHHLIPMLRRLRGPAWDDLIDRVMQGDAHHDEPIALILMLVRLNGCIACETDSYRAMKGCAACAAQTLRRYKGSDDELLALFETALSEVRAFARTHREFHIDPMTVGSPGAAAERTA
jgi:hypothetical protein